MKPNNSHVKFGKMLGFASSAPTYGKQPDNAFIIAGWSDQHEGCLSVATNLFGMNLQASKINEHPATKREV